MNASQADIAPHDLPDSVRRASLILKILAGLYAAAILFDSLPGSNPASLLEIVAFNVVNTGLAVTFVLVALALDRGQGWAISAIRPFLALLLVYGAYVFLSQLAAGAFRIPITMVAAGLALFWRADGWPAIRLSVRGGIVLLVLAALCIHQTVSRPLWGWGGYFDVSESDLHPTLTVDCGTAEPPERLTVAYEWSWSGDALLPNDEDQVVIGWNGDGVDGRPLYVAIELPEQSDGFRLGVSSGASGPMASQVKAAWRGNFMIRLDLHKLEIRPGRFEAVLVRTAAQPAPGQTMTFGATYVHAGVWQKAAPPVTCTW